MNRSPIILTFGESTTTFSDSTPKKPDIISEENERKRIVQLLNFEAHKRDESKPVYLSMMSEFGQLLTSNTKEERIKTIMTDDFGIFLFNFAETPSEYTFSYEGFTKLFEHKRIIRREVKETYISLKKATGFQICHCEIIDEIKGSSMCQFSFEIFTFNGNRISKYRASYGCMPMSYDPQSLFIPTKKEQLLAKIKELNYAWADQPDLEKIASLMHESTEYKIWRWNDKKCFVFDKQNIASGFRKGLEEEFIITSVVPYGVSCEAQYVVGSYVYHLEKKQEVPAQKFIWVSSCLYAFDQNFNIKKMSQQGELYPEGEKTIPYQALSKKNIVNGFLGTQNNRPKKEDFSIFNTEVFNFSFDVIVFGYPYSPFTGHIKGLSQSERLEQIIDTKDITIEKRKIVDYYEDIDDPCYDSIILVHANRGIIHKEDCPYHGRSINIYTIAKFSFENGKLAKIFLFPSAIPDPIPSPYDDPDFSDINFRPKTEF